MWVGDLFNGDWFIAHSESRSETADHQIQNDENAPQEQDKWIGKMHGLAGKSAPNLPKYCRMPPVKARASREFSPLRLLP